VGQRWRCAPGDQDDDKAAFSGGAAARRAGGTITAGQLLQQIRLVASQKAFAGLILRVDSPGGDALASDLIWRELRVLAEKKPVIASMGDVAASGGARGLFLVQGRRFC
jgi:ClpP class serine protease